LGDRVDLATLRRLFFILYTDFEDKGYFQESFGYFCVDAGDVPGLVGPKIENYVFLRLRKDNLWPVFKQYLEYAEEDLFDVLEFLYDHVSKPIPETEYYHQYGDCGWHYKDFDRRNGQKEYRNKVNTLLKQYGDYELSRKGEILSIAVPGTEALFESQMPEYDKDNVNNRLGEAVIRFRRHHSSLDDKKNAVKTLTEILEFIRPKLKAVITKADESELFNIANNFGIRHHNEKQKTDYDQEVWLDWMFYYYLATINAVLRLIKRTEKDT
jgi:hypothetical protein